MRKWLLVTVALLMAGCLDDPDTDDDTDAVETAEPQVIAPVTPENIEQSDMVVGGLDPANFVTGTPCGTPPDPCIRVPFEITAPTNLSANATVGSVNMAVTLTWTIDGNDFDLYLYQDGEQVQSAADAPPEIEESFTHRGGVGSYEAVIVPWGVVQDTYTLTVEFS